MSKLASRNGSAVLPRFVHLVWPVPFQMGMKEQIVLVRDRLLCVMLWMDFLVLMITTLTRLTKTLCRQTVGDIPAALFGSCEFPPEGEADLIIVGDSGCKS